MSYNPIPTLSGDNAIFDGNVGIGTDTPSEKLTVAGTLGVSDATQTATLALSCDALGDATISTSGDLTINAANLSTTGSISATNITAQNLSITGATTVAEGATWTYGTGAAAVHRTALGLGTGDSPTFERIGIGVTTPSSLLVVGNGYSVNNSQIRTGSLEVQGYGLNNSWIADNMYYNGGFRHRSTGPAVLFYFNGDEGQFRNYSSASAGSVATNRANLKINSSGDFGVGSSVNNNPGIWTGATLFHSGATGKVGIGTITPSEKLDVVGNIAASGTVTGKNFVEGVYDVGTPAGSGATLSLANGSVQKITLTASTAETITLPAVVAGATLLVEVQQAAGGGGTITFQHADTSAVIWQGGTAPTMTSTANAVDVFSFVANAAGTKWRGTAAQNFPS